MVTGRVGSVTMSAVESLDTSAKSLDASAKYFGRVGEICWTRRRNPWTWRRNILDSPATFWSPRRHKIGRPGKDTASATTILDASAYDICRLGTCVFRMLFISV